MEIDLSGVSEEFPVKDIDEGAGVEESPEYAVDIDCYLRKCEVGVMFTAVKFIPRTRKLDGQ